MDDEMEKWIYEAFKAEIESRRQHMMDVYLKNQGKKDVVEDG